MFFARTIPCHFVYFTAILISILLNKTMPRPVKYSVGASKREVYKPSQQACPPQEALPRYYYVQPLQNVPSTAWGGAQTYVDYEIPANTGVMTEATLRFNVKWNQNATANASTYPTLPSTPFWVDHVEVYLGSDLIETVWKHDIWNEEIGFRSIQELSTVANAKSITSGDNPTTIWSAYNTCLDGTFPAVTQNDTSSNSYWFLNLPTCLRSAKPYVRGFQSRLRFRVYFPTNLSVSSPLASDWTPSLQECMLIVEEAQTDASTIAELERAHKQSTVDYTVLVRSRVQQQYSAGAFSNGGDMPIYLRGFKNKSAGVVVYATYGDAFAQTSTAGMNARLQSSLYQLLDAQNNKITERLPLEWLETYVFHDAVNSSSTQSFDEAVSTMVIFPFSADFGTTIQKGCAYGGFRFTTLEQLVLNSTLPSGAVDGSAVVPPALSTNSTPAGITITATTYDYGHITVSGGRHSFRME